MPPALCRWLFFWGGSAAKMSNARTAGRISKMKARTALLVLIVAALGYLAFFNFSTLAQSTTMSLGFTEVQAPLGLVLLGLSALMAAIFLAYVIAMQATWLLEARSNSNCKRVCWSVWTV